MFMKASKTYGQIILQKRIFYGTRMNIDKRLIL